MSSRFEPHARRLLLVLLAGQFVANVDTSIANIATPSIQDDLGATGSELQLVVSGYVLAYAMLLITGARLGDTHGYRRMFLTGLVTFTAASLACGLAPDPLALIVARVVQGAGSALMVPQALSGIQLHFSGPARARALGLYAVALSSSAVVGQILGGVLVSADLLGTSWRPAFLINVPLGAALLVAAVRWLPCDRQGPRRPLDLGGVAMLSGATLLAVLPLVLGREAGWPAWTWASLAASVPALAAFIAWERGVIRRGGYPLMNLHVLRSPAVSWGLTAHGAGTMTYFSLLFVLAVYLQDGLGKSPLFSGLALVLWVAAFGIAGPLLPRLPERLAPLVPVAGCLILAAAYVALSAGVLADVAGGPLLVVLLGLGGFGLGTSFSGLIGHLTSAVPTGNAPDISGLLVMVAQMSGVVGVATFGTAYFALASDPARAFAIVAGVFALTSLAAALAAHRSTQPAEERRLARGALTRPSP